MKTKNNPLFTVNLKLFLILPITILVVFAVCSCIAKKKVPTVQTEITSPQPPDDIPFVVVEEMPMFPGGDSALLAYIANNTKYPETAKTNNIQGRVITRFCVNKEGGVDRVSILKGVSPELDAEALRVVNKLPSFKPGQQGGKPVSVWYMVPITFSLEKKSEIAQSEIISPPPLVDEVYTDVDKMPLFKDGEMGLLRYIAENTTYPEAAKKNNITGKVLVKFVVEKDCSVSQVGILEGVNPLIDDEAVRVVKSLPKFETPAIKDGIPVRVKYILPITFALK
jgi:TonB family protein